MCNLCLAFAKGDRQFTDSVPRPYHHVLAGPEMDKDNTQNQSTGLLEKFPVRVVSLLHLL